MPLCHRTIAPSYHQAILTSCAIIPLCHCIINPAYLAIVPSCLCTIVPLCLCHVTIVPLYCIVLLYYYANIPLRHPIINLLCQMMTLMKTTIVTLNIHMINKLMMHVTQLLYHPLLQFNEAYTLLLVSNLKSTYKKCCPHIMGFSATKLYHWKELTTTLLNLCQFNEKKTHMHQVG